MEKTARSTHRARQGRGMVNPAGWEEKIHHSGFIPAPNSTFGLAKGDLDKRDNLDVSETTHTTAGGKTKFFSVNKSHFFEVNKSSQQQHGMDGQPCHDSRFPSEAFPKKQRNPCGLRSREQSSAPPRTLVW